MSLSSAWHTDRSGWATGWSLRTADCFLRSVMLSSRGRWAEAISMHPSWGWQLDTEQMGRVRSLRD